MSNFIELTDYYAGKKILIRKDLVLAVTVYSQMDNCSDINIEINKGRTTNIRVSYDSVHRNYTDNTVTAINNSVVGVKETIEEVKELLCT